MTVEKINKVGKIDLKNEFKRIFPEIFEDNKINFERLKSLLSNEIIEKEDDRFYFNWAVKSNIFKLIQAPAYGTLKPDKEKSVDFDSTENIVIVGENLETLKLLLKPYFGKVKMIYIDPPYNTGKDFIYRDNFKQPLKDYLEKSGQIDSEGNKLTTNTEASGRYHSDWLNFIYPRLFFARSLLREDGVIFVSIDDNEVHHLRMIMDEIFGEDSFVSQIIVQSNKRGQTYKEISKTHEYLLLYTKTEEGEIIELEKDNDDLDYIDDVGRYNIRELRNRNPKFGKFNRPNLYYPIYIAINLMDDHGFCPVYLEKNDKYSVEVYPLDSQGKESCWRWGKKLVAKNIIENTRLSNIIAKKKLSGGYNIYEKYRKSTYKSKSIWYETSVITEQGTIELRELKLGGIYDFPKPIYLIKKALMLGCGKDDIILDFFAGSGTTGHAVYDLNKEDGGNRKFILVQLDEEVQDEEIKKEYPSVADICIERLKRVSEKYKKENENVIFNNHQDFGFKVFKLAQSNFNLKDEFEIKEGENIEELKKKYIEWLGIWINEPLISGWKDLDIIYEVILKEGLNLNSKIEQVKIKENKFYYISDSGQNLDFYISLDNKIENETVEEIRTTKYKDKMFVFLDKALTDNDKINLNAFVRLKVI